MSRTLFEIGEDLLALETLIEEADGDISDPAINDAVTAWIAEIDKDQAAKGDGYVNLIRKWEMEAAAAKAEAERYEKKSKVRAARIDNLKDRLRRHMVLTNQKKIVTASGREICIQKNGGVTPMEVAATVNPETLEKRFQRIRIELDTGAVRAALEKGEALAFAKLGERGTQLRIR